MPRIFHPLSSNSKTLRTFLLSPHDPSPLVSWLFNPQEPFFFKLEKSSKIAHTFFDCPTSSCCSSCSPFVPLSPLAARLVDLLHHNSLLVSLQFAGFIPVPAVHVQLLPVSFRFTVFIRFLANSTLVRRLRTVHRWFHPSSLVSSRFLLLACSSSPVSSRFLPFAYGSFRSLHVLAHFTTHIFPHHDAKTRSHPHP